MSINNMSVVPESSQSPECVRRMFALMLAVSSTKTDKAYITDTNEVTKRAESYFNFIENKSA